MSNGRILNISHSILLIVDIQDKLAAALEQAPSVIEKAGQLLQAAATLKVPVLITEQAPQKLGETVPQLMAFKPDQLSAVLHKQTFGALKDETIAGYFFSHKMGAEPRQQVVVCGMETHICVSQTVHQLLSFGFDVHVVQDAVSSRHNTDHQTGLAKMFSSGAIPSCTELALFEWLQTAENEHFKKIQALIK
jgi:nicotinamidase-related amidase